MEAFDTHELRVERSENHTEQVSSPVPQCGAELLTCSVWLHILIMSENFEGKTTCVWSLTTTREATAIRISRLERTTLVPTHGRTGESHAQRHGIVHSLLALARSHVSRERVPDHARISFGLIEADGALAVGLDRADAIFDDADSPDESIVAPFPAARLLREATVFERHTLSGDIGVACLGVRVFILVDRGAARDDKRYRAGTDELLKDHRKISLSGEVVRSTHL